MVWIHITTYHRMTAEFILKYKREWKVTKRWIAGQHNYMSRCTSDGIPERTAAFGGQMRGRVSVKIRFERNNFSLHICYHYKWLGTEQELKLLTERDFYIGTILISMPCCMYEVDGKKRRKRNTSWNSCLVLPICPQIYRNLQEHKDKKIEKSWKKQLLLVQWDS